MKRSRSTPLRAVLLALAVLLLLAGCKEASDPQFAETTLTLTNSSSQALSWVSVDPGAPSSRKFVGYNILESGEFLAAGESLVIPLLSILHPDSSASVTVEWTASELLQVDSTDFTYEEGAEVIITFTDETEHFTIENGTIPIPED